MCVYSDSLDWVTDFTPYKLRYSKNHGPVKWYNMQSLSDRDCVYLSYLNTHKSYFWTGPIGLQPCKIRAAQN